MFHHTPVLVLGIGIGIGQYYWVLGALLVIVLTLGMMGSVQSASVSDTAPAACTHALLRQVIFTIEVLAAQNTELHSFISELPTHALNDFRHISFNMLCFSFKVYMRCFRCLFREV